MRSWTRALALIVVAGALTRAAPARADVRYATVTARKCPIFTAPSESSPVRVAVTRGTVLEVGGIRGNWVKVRTTDSRSVVGFVTKAMVVPGRRQLDGSESEPAPTSGRTRGPGPTVEGRTGLLARAGLELAANAYSFSAQQPSGFSRSVGMNTPYAGLNAEADYWFLPALGGHFRYANALGSMSCELSAPVNKKVDRIPTNIDRIELDAMGRFYFGSSPSSGSLIGRLGYHIHEMRIDPVVDSSGQALYLVTNSYKGPVLGVGVDLPLGSPSLGVKARLDYWLAPSLSEGIQASGSPSGATGLDFAGGAYYNFSDTTGFELGLEYADFTGTFSGTGQRFDTTVTNSQTNDTYLLFGLNGTFRF